jgi:hypothetical protein
MSIYKRFYCDNIYLENDKTKQKELITTLGDKLKIFYIDNNLNSEHVVELKFKIEIYGINIQICIQKNDEDQYTYLFETYNLYTIRPSNGEKARIIVYRRKTYFDDLIVLFEDLDIVKDTYLFFESQFISPKQHGFNCEKIMMNPHRCPHCSYKTELCSICFEPTCLYTKCKHPLCLKCRQKCMNHYNYKCPICRRDNVFEHNLLYKQELDPIFKQYDDMEMVELDTMVENTEMVELDTMVDFTSIHILSSIFHIFSCFMNYHRLFKTINKKQKQK